MNAREWFERFAEELGVPAPDRDEMDAILDLAGVAAHSSERIAAPIACWLGARSGRPLEELKEIADRIGGEG